MYRPSSSDSTDMSRDQSVQRDDEGQIGTESALANASTQVAEATAPDHAGVLVDFKQELIRAMRSAAELERERVEATIAASIESHLEKVRTRAAAEAEELRHLADSDIDGIHEWSKTETTRIQEEADRRIGARRRQLENHVEQHASITEREVGSIEGAVQAYRSEVEQYFMRLTNEQDPSELARLAGLLPPPPDLEQIGSDARTQAVGSFASQAPAAFETTAESDADRPSAFSPTEAGPSLVPVMAEPAEAEPAEAEPAEEELAKAEPAEAQPTEAQPTEAQPTEAAPVPVFKDDTEEGPGGGDIHAESNGTLQRLRSLAGLGPKGRQDD